MQNLTRFQAWGVTQLTAINLAKVLTIVCLIACALVFGLPDLRQLLYMCLHLSYCCWWLFEQWLYPQRRQLFSDPVGPLGLISALLIVGIFYALPGYLAFTNPEPLSFLTAAIALVLYIFGSLINTSADVQKMTAKQFSLGLVRDGIWRFCRNVNYFGDLLRYFSFAVLAGSIWAYLVPGSIALLYLKRIAEKEQAMSEKYADYSDYQKASTRLIPFLW
ncbi:DUF1295 domain-containing protein [Leptolyngbya sp. FACHB-261]|uniref:DUF1295 domain-containing protein n=1 Tax=Leptolyngbya sp. FACHB-261 TaxID=2692806 RepID=UPI0016899AF4|nr:DUF1295 domain-containing protein [Leptolyngbya sp. FACHB-261]MBD2102096.1 DUF1295 domain-containing protein [Leptolyngbya sp. FACHB-261]